MAKLPSKSLRELSGLQHLDLSNNKLRSVSDTSFHFLRKLKTLELQDNEIIDLMKGTFQVRLFLNKFRNSVKEYYINYP